MTKMETYSLAVDVRTLRSRQVRRGRPEVCGFYSLDGQRKYRGDLSQLKYLRQPTKEELARGFDLDVGTAAALARDDARDNPRLDNLLTWLRDPQVDRDHRLKSQWKPEIVTNRRTLRFIMQTPYLNPSWTITAQFFDGVVYLYSTCTTPKWAESEDNRKRSMWGNKFEEYVTTDQFGSDKAVVEVPTMEDSKFYTIFAYKIGKHRVVYMAEIDCIESKCKVENLQDLQRSDTSFIEFKTNRIIWNAKQWASLKEHKFPKWWDQCHLTNINRVICGFVKNSGVVNKLETFTTDAILSTRYSRDDEWRPEVCLNFMDTVLEFIKEVTFEKDRSAPTGNLWEFEAKKSNDNGTIEVHARCQSDGGSGGNALLPKWFTSSKDGVSKPSTSLKRKSHGPKQNKIKKMKKLTKLTLE